MARSGRAENSLTRRRDIQGPSWSDRRVVKRTYSALVPADRYNDQGDLAGLSRDVLHEGGMLFAAWLALNHSVVICGHELPR
jgi:hypothetical protein